MIKWEIVSKATEFIAEEMGIALKRSAISPNIRERMDHSCAVLDSTGKIVAQAEHIPVHLGSFKIGADNIINWMEENNVVLDAGDMLILNDPYISGTHLNDVTVIAPVYLGPSLMAYVINKAHNVDVGGPLPGSLNPSAIDLYGEGFVIPPVKILKNGALDKEILAMILENFKDPETTEGDLNAQLAANRMGIRRVLALLEKFGADVVRESWKLALNHSAKLSQIEISKWKKGDYSATDYLEVNGEELPVRVKISISGQGITADYTGTHEQVRAPLNAVPGVTYSATAFVIRCLMNGFIPTNDGFYSTIKAIAPKGCLLSPDKPYPVAGGNVETTQRVADVAFLAMSKALKDKVPAASSGTMMNVMIGGPGENGGFWAYYETIGGGNGARPDSDGISGVHSNMTNTLNTPIEVAEMTYPLIFTSYKLRESSGGNGRRRGGDGIVRSFKVLSESTLSMIGERFIIPPWGLEGGGPGKKSTVSVLRKGKREEMSGKFTLVLQEGDEVIIETPGGGGYGRPDC